MKLLVIDNYDSFVYNLVHYIRSLRPDIHISVAKNDALTLETVASFDKILLSPGPGLPKEAGIMPAVIKNFALSKSILGVCLGHQAIAECFGASLKNLSVPLHGISSKITVLHPDYLFENLPQQFAVGHYHSWVVEPGVYPELEILAIDENENIMALRHKTWDVRGVQFHPESILTEYGKHLLENWLKQTH